MVVPRLGGQLLKELAGAGGIGLDDDAGFFGKDDHANPLGSEAADGAGIPAEQAVGVRAFGSDRVVGRLIGRDQPHL